MDITVQMAFKLEELIGVPLLIERDEDEFIEGEIEVIKDDLVKISPQDGNLSDYWVEMDNLVIRKILFRYP